MCDHSNNCIITIVPVSNPLMESTVWQSFSYLFSNSCKGFINNKPLVVNSTPDSLIMSSILGIGVCFAGISVFLYEACITL